MSQNGATVVITDHSFASIEPQREVIEGAGFRLKEAVPICRTEDEIIERCEGGVVLLVQWAPVTRKVLQAMPSVRCIVRYGVGVNNFDLEAAQELEVVAANVPDYCVEEVSDHTMAMMVSLARRMPQDHAQIRRGEWGVGKYLPIRSFRELVVGLFGFGAIARRVAEKIRCLGPRVLATDPNVPDAVFAKYGVERASFERLLEVSDILSLHAPLRPETTHIMNKGSIGRMKRDAILINTSRGGLVNELDLIAALEQGKLVGAGLDVFEQEPLPAGNPLRHFDNVILTSHAASVSEQAVHSLQVKAAGVARDFLLGQSPYSVVRPD